MADIGELTAKLTLDTQGFSDSIGSIQGMAQGLATGIGGALGSVAAAVGTGVAAAAAAVGSLVTEAVSSFGQFEQLASGAQQIFDQMDYSKIAQDASNAYLTMNMSASQYLSVINQIGATMAASLGDTQGYETARQGMQAISDYASGTGRSVDELSQKFALITRSAASYQSIADQFSGILPQTSQAFLQQAQAAGLLTENYKTLTQVPLAEYQTAVTTMLTAGVEALSLTGKTASESTTTITGSINALKAAMKNLVTGLADSSADLGQLFSAVANQAEVAFQQILPAVSTALNGISQVIADVAPVLASAIPEILGEVAPMLLDAAVSIVDTLVAALPELVNSITETLTSIIPQFVSALFAVLDTLMTSVLPAILNIAIELVLALGRGIVDNAETLISSIMILIMTIVETIVENLPVIIGVGLEIVLALATALVENEQLLISAVTELVVGLVTTLLTNIPKFLEVGVKIVLAIATGIITAIPRLILAFGQVTGLIEGETKGVSKTLGGMESDVKKTSNTIETTLNVTSASINTHMNNIRTTGAQALAVTRSNASGMEAAARAAELNVAQSFESSLRTSEGFKESLDKTDEWVKEATVKIYDANGEIVDSFETVTETVKSHIEDMSDAAEKKRAYIESALNSVANSADNAASDVENSVDRMNSALGRLSGGNIDISARAGGGPVQAGVPYLTGEEGRELFVPKTDGYIMNHDDTEDFISANARGEAIVININGDVYDNAQSMRQKMKSAILSVMQEQVAYG